MADVLDNLMSSLQGHLVKSKNDKNSPNAGATFEEVEEGATSLSAEVKEHKVGDCTASLRKEMQLLSPAWCFTVWEPAC